MVDTTRKIEIDEFLLPCICIEIDKIDGSGLWIDPGCRYRVDPGLCAPSWPSRISVGGVL